MKRTSGLFWLALGMLGGGALGPSGGCNCPDFQPAAIPRGLWVLSEDGDSDSAIFDLLETDAVEIEVGDEFIVLRYSGPEGESVVTYEFDTPNDGSVQPDAD